MAPPEADYQPASLRGASIKMCTGDGAGRGKRARENEQETRSCKLDSMQMTARSRSRSCPPTLEIRCRIYGAHLDYIVKAIFDAVVTGQSGLHLNKTIPVPDVRDVRPFCGKASRPPCNGHRYFKRNDLDKIISQYKFNSFSYVN
ncbi:hypothetical protein ALC56_04468 [Trachymyrmex septentrionalis]|uniref:Uncharacterized protein n=1 Tax=Trachymyrmex septentrionalis TaxID=34720 RepID=A0A195FM36_9HYME|nr:hypothetical protein ALC56_04468 [Trachymyrmex septentrionalis]